MQFNKWSKTMKEKRFLSDSIIEWNYVEKTES
jgi:hypothetical protein